MGIGIRAIDQRASILDASNLLEDAALDRYEFIRDGYLQRRDSRVYDDERSQEKHEKKLLKKQQKQGQEQDPDAAGGKVDMKKAYGDDADDAGSGKVDMKKAYGDDANDAGPAPAGAPVPPPQQGSSSEKVQK